MSQEFEYNDSVVYLSNDQINEYLEQAHQRDIQKLENGELDDKDIQYIETKKEKKYRLLGDKLFHQALERKSNG